MKRFLIYAAKILFLLLVILLVFVSVLGMENYAKLIFLLMMGFFIGVLCFERKWVGSKKFYFNDEKNEGWFKFLKSAFFYILTFFDKYVFFPLLNKMNYA